MRNWNTDIGSVPSKWCSFIRISRLLMNVRSLIISATLTLGSRSVSGSNGTILTDVTPNRRNVLNSFRDTWVLSPSRRTVHSNIRFSPPISKVYIRLLTHPWLNRVSFFWIWKVSNGGLLQYLVTSWTSSTDARVRSLMLVSAWFARIVCCFS